MVRRSTGFVSKRAHQKSRSGCLGCKRKRVKCDEDQPACGYCSLRKLNCEYPQDGSSKSLSSASTSSSKEASPKSTFPVEEGHFNDLSIQSRLVPVLHTSSGCLSSIDLEILHHYKTSTWQHIHARGCETINALFRDSIPQMSISGDHLLYAILSIAASHSNSMRPNKHFENQALVYRQKTFSAYNKALQNITTGNYETIMLTGTFMLALVPLPESSIDEEYLDWIYTFLKMGEGVRILASLRWDTGIEKLSIYPLFQRELQTLPPPPVMHASALHTQPGPLGTTPDHPNPASTYYWTHPNTAAFFLPPSLMALLLVSSDHQHILMPVFHALSPIFLSLYYYHLNPDLYVRICAFSSFLMPKFLQLIKEKEPRALVLVSWWFALADLMTRGCWVGGPVRQVVRPMGRIVRSRGDRLLDEAIGGAQRIVDVFEKEGREMAARSVFEGWEGVEWNDGPKRAEEWEMRLFEDLDLNLGGSFEVMV